MDRIDTKDKWALRRQYCLKNVYTNLTQLIEDSQAPPNVSLATFKPASFIDFIVEPDEREWKPAWKAQLQQLSLDFGGGEEGKKRELIRKLPYKFYYKFLDDEGRESRMMIEDWEIGQLYWNCFKAAKGDEQLALEKVRHRYWTEFIDGDHDIYLFLGTLMESHRRRFKNPFVIIGVFYPKKERQMRLF